VRPGDVIFVRGKILEPTRSHPKPNRPDRGIVRLEIEAVNQRDEIVMSFFTNVLVPAQ
jgi:acyl dehydratase